MKKIIYIAVILILSSCNPIQYIQIFETESTNTKIENNCFVYETDTVKITYSFWAEKGILSFAIYNKLDIPLYIDWKKSAYISNSNKLNYWVDEEQSNAISSYGNYYYSGPLLKAGYSESSGTGLTTTTKIKIERITFIPPKSNYYRSQFYLLPITYFQQSKILLLCNEVDRIDNPKKKTKIYESKYYKNYSPLVFRNFLTLSLSEDIKQEFYVDNEFYISNIKEMAKGRFSSFTGVFIPYNIISNKNTSFFISVPDEYELSKKIFDQ